MNSVIDSRQLRAFAVLARTGRFTIAAKELSLTQSAVSHAIRTLEEDLDCRLFDRTGQGVVLTTAGRQLLKYVEGILVSMKEARSSLARANVTTLNPDPPGAATMPQLFVVGGAAEFPAVFRPQLRRA